MEWWHYVLTFIGSGTFVSLVQFFIQRHDNKKNKGADIETKLEQMRSEVKEELEQIREEMRARFAKQEHEELRHEKDNIRIQMMFMMEFHPDRQEEIMTMAYRYFKELEGDWYMTGFFYNWLEQHKVAKPEWFHLD